jgi:peptidoglycan/xylan/chitin deacetylase (PgdA/CDA1 family)
VKGGSNQIAKELRPRGGLRRRSKLILLYVLKLLGAFTVARLIYRRRVRILCYHGAWCASDGYSGDSMFIRPETFAGRLNLLRGRGFNVISLEQAMAGLRDGVALPPDSVVITMDDGWHTAFSEMLPRLKAMRMPATIYCDTANLMAGFPIAHIMACYLRQLYVTGEMPPQAEANFDLASDLDADRSVRHAALLRFAEYLGVDLKGYWDARQFDYMTPKELRAAAADGFSVELHTHHHRMHDFGPQTVAEEIRENRRVLGALLDRPESSFRHFCYPAGKVAPRIDTMLADFGIASATTLESGLADHGTNPRLLPRLTDGNHLSALEFEAQLCGIGDLLRRLVPRTAIRPFPAVRPKPGPSGAPVPHAELEVTG